MNVFLILLLSTKRVYTNETFIVNAKLILCSFIANDIESISSGRLVTLSIKTHKENCLPNTRA